MLPVCNKCGNQWSWKETIGKAFLPSADGMICPYCKERQYESKPTKLQIIAWILSVFIVVFADIYFELSVQVFMILVAIHILAFIILKPFFIKLSNKKELLL